MDSLQVGLIVAGVALIVAVIAYNKWQELKHRRHAEKAFQSRHRDVLLEPQEGGARAENFVAEEDGAPSEPLAERMEPCAEAPKEPPKRAAPDNPAELHPAIDCIIRIEAFEETEAPRLWSAQREHIGEISRPVKWFAFDNAANQWRPLGTDSDGAYSWFCAALQLADRNGPIDETDFLRFSGGIQQLADTLCAAPAELPARAQVLSQAADLDRFCADVDVQVGVNVIATDQPFSGSKLRGIAEAQGMLLEEDGSFRARDEDGNVLYTLSNLEQEMFTPATMTQLQTRGFTLFIDVPTVKGGASAFDRMMLLAKQFSSVLDGAIVDDNRSVLGSDSIALIRKQISQFQEHMSGFGIPAGSIQAKRLFSA